MVKFAALYTFPESAFETAVQRLQRLGALNPGITFFPMVGPRQLFYIPMIVDQFMFGSNAKFWGRPIWGSVSHIVNWLASAAPGVFRLSQAANKRSIVFVKKNMLNTMRARIHHMGLQPLQVDFTPMALWNLDHSIMEWFNSSGSQFDFDYLIFYESDIFTTKPLDVLYQKYTELYDACFIDFEIASKNWRFYNFPPGCRRATMRWLTQRTLPTTLYRSIFAGALISRRCLERLRELRIDFSGVPYCQNEMRFPTMLTALGFRCGKLDFPFVRYRPEWSLSEIFANQDAGIFHPVKRPISAEIKITAGQM
jgi:hypothetical protein